MNNGCGNKEKWEDRKGYIKRWKGKFFDIQHTKALVNNSNLIINMKIHEHHEKNIA